MWLIKNPFDFDVIVASNLFGDIGRLGFRSSGRMGFAAGRHKSEKNSPHVRSIHGSAPKYAGKGIINQLLQS